MGAKRLRVAVSEKADKSNVLTSDVNKVKKMKKSIQKGSAKGYQQDSFQELALEGKVTKKKIRNSLKSKYDEKTILHKSKKKDYKWEVTTQKGKKKTYPSISENENSQSNNIPNDEAGKPNLPEKLQLDKFNEQKRLLDSSDEETKNEIESKPHASEFKVKNRPQKKTVTSNALEVQKVSMKKSKTKKKAIKKTQDTSNREAKNEVTSQSSTHELNVQDKLKKTQKKSGQEGKKNSSVDKIEIHKAKKRPLDSSDDEDEIPSANIQRECKAEDIPAVPQSLFSLTGDSIAAPAPIEESSDEEDLNKGEAKKRRKVSRAQRQRDATQLEEQLREAERSRLTKDTIGPQTEDDYRELLLTNKACSATWIQYISFLLAAGEHERARATARRGLSIIPFEEQQERINLWTVLLRLEVMYGMDESSAETALAEACSNADDYTILTNMANIYQENEMLDKAEEIHKRVTKKYYAEFDAWIRIGQFYFSSGQLDNARTALSRALRVLKTKQGVDVTCRFAQLEHKYGDVDKAKNMFESLLANYPKRLDVWNVYADLLIKSSDVEQARNVLSRMCCLQIRMSKKVQIFGKWRQFEKTQGTPGTLHAARCLIDELIRKDENSLDE